MTMVPAEASVQTPEEERAARKDELERFYNRTPELTPLFPFDNLLAIEEHIHSTLVGTTIPEQRQYLQGMEDGNPMLKKPVREEPLIAWLVRIAKGEVHLPNPN